jgi:3-oxoacyl-[acyl-carrier protein] reductase
MPADSGLRDKVVIVTGAAAGIGRATALRFAEEGARIAAWDVNEEAGAALVDEIARMGVEAAFSKVDVTQSSEVNGAASGVVGRWDRIDVLVNNAGILRDGQMIKWKDGDVLSVMTDEMFDAVLDVNLKGVFYCARAVVPQMIRQHGGVILNASSVVGLYGNFGQSNYAATKAAVINMTRTWSRELGKFNIRVNAVAPGFIGTEILRSMPQKVLDAMVSHTPLGRMGEPRDIADAYVWLASDRASFVHGATLSVDGGLVVGT